MVFVNIEFKNFQKKKKNNKIKIILNNLIENYLKFDNQLLLSLSKKYKYKFSFEKLQKYKKFKNVRIFGMGGSIHGAEAIYQFLNHKIKKNFQFINNISFLNKQNLNNEKLNIIISKSGNTLETLTNLNSENVKKKPDGINKLL